LFFSLMLAIKHKIPRFAVDASRVEILQHPMEFYTIIMARRTI
jgi:hypothetical protein